MSGFASTKDLADQAIGFHGPAPGLYGCTAEGNPDNGVITGGDSGLILATPVIAAGNPPPKAAPPRQRPRCPGATA